MNKTYAYHQPSPKSSSAITRLRQAYSNLDDLINNLCLPSRERSVALTELQTSAMWAIKSVVSNDPLSTVEDQ